MRRQLADAQAAAAALAAEKAELVAEKVRHEAPASCIACHAVHSTLRVEKARVLTRVTLLCDTLCWLAWR